MIVYFDDGSTGEFDLLVGADGVGSRVRSQLLPNSKISGSDVAVLYLKIPLTPDTKDLLPAASTVMVQYAPRLLTSSLKSLLTFL